MITGWFGLDWALVAFSIFNTMIVLWLALTIWLNAERRTFGVYLIAGGLLLGAVFFISHTAILSYEMILLKYGFTVWDGIPGLNRWWKLGWIPVVLSPAGWYVVILWYSGFWEDASSRLHKRHRLGLIAVYSTSVVLLLLLFFAHPLPTYNQVMLLDFSTSLGVGGVPLLFVIYPIFAIACILLPIDALLRPEPSKRMMGDLARQRSRPWLLAVSGVFLLVSLLVGLFIVWVVNSSNRLLLTHRVVRYIALFDLLLVLLIGTAILLLGQAVVAYEVFTGKVLPRHGFARQWNRIIFLSAVIAGMIGWLLVYQPLPAYSLISLSIIVIALFALLNWRSFVEREQFIQQLRPFVSSQQSRAGDLFEAICREMLGAQQAQLIPLGMLAPLIEAPLIYPAQADPLPLPPNFAEAHDLMPLEGYGWAIPLWGERGLIGALLLGSKQHGGLYTQEEIEIARASAERIIEMLASEQMARRLMDIQRHRYTETRILDLRTRRILHDEVLPALHTAVLSISSLRDPAAREAVQAVSAVHAQISELIHAAANQPAAVSSDLGASLKALVLDEFGEAFDQVELDLPPTLPALEPLTQEVVFGAVRESVRNAALHGRGDQPKRALKLRLAVGCQPDLTFVIQDDGVGMNYPASKEKKAGSGGGLALHSTMLALVGGYLTLENNAPTGTKVSIILANIYEQS